MVDISAEREAAEARHGKITAIQQANQCRADGRRKARQKRHQAERDQQPLLVVAGVSLPECVLEKATHEWLALKKHYYPSSAANSRGGWLDTILHGLKGTTVRNGFKISATNRQRKNAIGFLDNTLKILERHDAKIIGRIWMKRLNVENDGMAMYGTAVLPSDERGMVVVDSQTYRHNSQLAHSMFTQRFGKAPKHRGLVDMPVFGHSDNHAGLQMADMICSAMLAPIACAVYAGQYKAWNRHCNSGFIDIREAFGTRIAARTFVWQDSHGQDVPSLVLSNPVSRQGIRLMWSPETTPRCKPRAKKTRRPHRRLGSRSP